MRDNTVLVVDDDEALLGAVQKKFETAGFDVQLAVNGAEARESIQNQRPDLVILDLMLPDDDGTDICRDIRANSDVPIIMLTARAEETDRIVGLELGADDYVTKPFSLSELVARARAVLRRAPANDEPEVQQQKVLEAADIRIDLKAHEVTVNDQPVSLTPTEYRLLVALMKRQGEVVSADELLEAVWDHNEYDTHLVEVHMANLRRKIEDNPKQPQRIHTVRAFGYRLG